MTTKIYFCNHDDNDAAGKYRWEVYSNGDVGTFFNAIADEKEFGDGRDNPVSMGGEGNVEDEDQSVKSVPLFNEKIDALKKLINENIDAM